MKDVSGEHGMRTRVDHDGAGRTLGHAIADELAVRHTRGCGRPERETGTRVVVNGGGDDGCAGPWTDLDCRQMSA